jgi:hypothetical protein
MTGSANGSIAVTNGTTFKGLGSYTPSAARKYIVNENPNAVVWTDPTVLRSSPVEV